MSRGLTFWNDETIALIRENFIAVAVPTWTARAEGPEGEFLRAAGLEKHWVTSSGYMNCVSASGKFLGRRPGPEVLEAFAALPESEQQVDTLDLPELAPSEFLTPAPPKGGITLMVHARFLARGEKANLRQAQPTDFPLMANSPEVQRSWRLFLEPNTECMWITREEWEAMVPRKPKVDEQLPLPSAVLMRMARFHLNPKRATTSEGGIIPARLVKKARAHLVVEEVARSSIRMRLEGEIHWGSDYDASQATSPNGPLRAGFQAPLLGRLDYDLEAKSFTRFDVVAVGDVWGRWGDANGKSMYVERPGRAPFGFAFELAPGKSPTERIPPGGNGHYVEERAGYFSANK